MQLKSIAEHSVTLSTFIKLLLVIMTFVLSIFEWPFYTGFIVVKEEVYLEAIIGDKRQLTARSWLR